MRGEPDLSVVGALLAEPARIEILQALCEQEALPASELARRARVSAATASAHLGRLKAAGFVTCEARGRHRLYRLGSRHVARLLEAAARVAPSATPSGSLDRSRAAALRRARTCYDHLAGRLGVALAARLLDLGVLQATRGDLRLVQPTHPLLARLGIDAQAGAGRRPLARGCLDWSERRPHLAGVLGARMAARFLEAGWVGRVRDCRALRLTERGRLVLRDVLQVSPEEIERA